VIVETTYGTVTIPRDQILAIDKTKRSVVEEFKTKEAATDMKDADAVWKLSAWARENGMPRHAKQLLQKVIELNPDHEFARRELGFSLYQGQWLTHDEMMAAKGFVKHRGKWLTASERELALRAEMEAAARKDEERRKKEEARKPKEEPKLKPGIEEKTPTPLYTPGDQGYRDYAPGFAPGGYSFYYGYYQYPSYTPYWWPNFRSNPWWTGPFR
jgi:recombinational DNA repair protein RecT